MKLDQIRALIEAATPGPWALCLSREWYQIRAGNDVCAMAAQIQDARYVAASRTLMPKLVAVAEAAKRLSDNIAEFDVPTDSCFLERVDDAIAALEAE